MQYTTAVFVSKERDCCFIRISKILLYAIHNYQAYAPIRMYVVLSGFQRTILLQKYKKSLKSANLRKNILLFLKKVLPLQQQIWRIYTIRIIPLCKHSEWHASVALFYFYLYTIYSEQSLQSNIYRSCRTIAKDLYLSFLKRTIRVENQDFFHGTNRRWC